MSIKASDVSEWLLGSGPHLVVVNILYCRRTQRERNTLARRDMAALVLVAVTTE
jgi:hypothetical protein